MAAIAAVKLVFEDFCWTEVGGKRDLSFCREFLEPFLRKHFYLPKGLDGVRCLWLSLHRHAASDRLRIPVELEDVYDPYPCLIVPGYDERDGRWDYTSLDRVLKPYVGKSIYLQVEYE